MPNHVSTRLTVTGPVGDVNKFIDAAKGKTKDGEIINLDFNALYPMPESLRITSGSTTERGIFALTGKFDYYSPLDNAEMKNLGIDTVAKYKEWLEKNEPQSLIEGQKALDNIVKYGHKDWYSWACANWGTKWGAYDAGEWHDGVIHYNTAWSPATAFYLHVSQQWPTLTFKHEYADDGGGFVGWEEIHNGEVTAEAELDWDSSFGKELRTELGYGDCEEEEVER